MEPVPASVSRLLSLVRHPVRLPLLLELERLGEASTTDLSQRLGVSFDAVHYALRQLADEGAVEFVRQESRPGSNVSRNVFRPHAAGWTEFAGLLEDYADRLLDAPSGP